MKEVAVFARNTLVWSEAIINNQNPLTGQIKIRANSNYRSVKSRRRTQRASSSCSSGAIFHYKSLTWIYTEQSTQDVVCILKLPKTKEEEARRPIFRPANPETESERKSLSSLSKAG